jgi:hypothetical protein
VTNLPAHGACTFGVVTSAENDDEPPRARGLHERVQAPGGSRGAPPVPCGPGPRREPSGLRLRGRSPSPRVAARGAIAGARYPTTQGPRLLRSAISFLIRSAASSAACFTVIFLVRAFCIISGTMLFMIVGDSGMTGKGMP